MYGLETKAKRSRGERIAAGTGPCPDERPERASRRADPRTLLKALFRTLLAGTAQPRALGFPGHAAPARRRSGAQERAFSPTPTHLRASRRAARASRHDVGLCPAAGPRHDDHRSAGPAGSLEWIGRAQYPREVDGLEWVGSRGVGPILDEKRAPLAVQRVTVHSR